MPLQLLTIADLQQWKEELMTEMKRILHRIEEAHTRPLQPLLRSKEVCRLLHISAGTLQTLRRNNSIAYSRIGGSIVYNREDILKMIRK